MRTFIQSLLCCSIALFFMPSCTTDATTDDTVVVNNISVKDAENWTSAWKVDINSTTLTPIQGFTLADIDLTQLLAEPGVDSARFYIGKKPSGDLLLMVLGVNSSGEDMYDKSLGQYIYDFSKPCPDDCGSLVDSN